MYTSVSMLLYTYQEVIVVMFMMLKCTPVNGVNVLFYEGNTECYQSWQYVTLTSIVVHFVPFWITLTFGPKLMERGQLTMGQFILACMVPLFCAPYLVMKYSVRPKSGRTKSGTIESRVAESDFRLLDVQRVVGEPKENWRSHYVEFLDKDKDEGQVEKQKLISQTGLLDLPDRHRRTISGDVNDRYDAWPAPIGAGRGDLPTTSSCTRGLPIVKRLVTLFVDPYRDTMLGGLCYEGLLNLRRLVLAVLLVFIGDQLVRQIALSAACLFFLMVHLRVMPFRRNSANAVETGSLTLLFFLSGANLVRVLYHYNNVLPSKYGYVVELLTEWLEVGCFVVLPLSIVLLALFTICLRHSRRHSRSKTRLAAESTDRNWTADQRLASFGGQCQSGSLRCKTDDIEIDSALRNPEAADPDVDLCKRLSSPDIPSDPATNVYHNLPIHLKRWFPSYKGSCLGPMGVTSLDDDGEEHNIVSSGLSTTEKTSIQIFRPKWHGVFMDMTPERPSDGSKTPSHNVTTIEIVQ
ncbi:hypothetical protein LSH36_21g02015 [Paralvinella palmiformis]|uniref:Uncharacterized protein n=1 Tax=Paralvinella palmiformis TaxID=53620 RepID=A0AAD9NGR9_9ANNE|nr:hypothetical protein LSH36_21g02015 [Paralvinella palmiformis]